MRVLIAVGGGGHFSPAMSVIEQMPKDWEILLVGRKYTFEGDTALSLEYQTAKRLGLPFDPLTTGRLQRKFTRHTFTSLIKMPVGLAQANRIIAQFKPDVVLSFGGYVSLPVVLAAAAKRVPIVLHEQVLHAGLANKIAVRFATKICLSWEESQKFFPKEKSILTGNPVRKEFLKQNQESRIKNQGQDNNLPLIYVTGGSGGAHGINVLIEGCLEQLLEKYTLIHQTGDAKQFDDFARLEQRRSQLRPELQKHYLLKKFVDPEQVVQVLSQADLVIARSGINTVTELLYLGKPSLLIPLPYGQQNEQLANAEFMKKVGLATIVDQLTVTPEDLFEKIHAMISRLPSYLQHKKEAQQMIHLDAAQKIIEEVNYAKEKKPTAA